MRGQENEEQYGGDKEQTVLQNFRSFMTKTPQKMRNRNLALLCFHLRESICTFVNIGDNASLDMTLVQMICLKHYTALRLEENHVQHRAFDFVHSFDSRKYYAVRT